ncbi:MAG: hypothetical protein HQL88_01740 [Magnetococcales bacterium]|nr:hypothetical protein [Magnetococcales bacterium]
MATLVVQGVAVGGENPLYQQKLSLLNRFLDSSGTSKRVTATSHPEAESSLSAARSKRDAAQQAYASGAEKEALELLNQAIKLASEASRKSADQNSQEWLHRSRYEDLSDSIRYFQETYQKHLQHAGAEQRQAAQEVLDRVAPLIAESKALAAKKQYSEANRPLSRGQGLLIEGLKPLLGSRALVYALKFDTPRQEYEYEVRRGESLEALIRMALAESAKPGDEAEAVATLISQSREQQKKAQQLAAADRFESAIPTQEEANKFLVRALRQLGVMIPL